MDARAAALSALAQFQIAQTTVGEALQRIAEITLEAVPAAAIAGMSMMGEDGQPTTAVYTDADSPAIDREQYRENKGPCLDAWRNNRVYRVDRVIDATDEYPGFAAACAAHGVQSTLSLPMAAGEVAVGAINLYSRVPQGFAADDESVATDIAAAAGAVLANVSAYWTAFDLGQSLTDAMESRAVVEQAKGMLMAAEGMSPDAAFEALRRMATDDDVPLREVATRILERRTKGTGNGDE